MLVITSAVTAVTPVNLQKLTFGISACSVEQERKRTCYRCGKVGHQKAQCRAIVATGSEGYRRAAARFIADCALAGFERLEYQRATRGTKRVSREVDSTHSSDEENDNDSKKIKDGDGDTVVEEAAETLTAEEKKFRSELAKIRPGPSK